MENIKKLQQQLKKDTAAFIFGEANRAYFSGVFASDAVLLITKSGAYYLTDSRYTEAISKKADGFCVLAPRVHSDEIVRILVEQNVKTLLADLTYIPTSYFLSLGKKLEGNGIVLSHEYELDGAVTAMRAEKNETEKEKIRLSQEITDKTFSYILPRITEGRTEREIALDMEFFARKNGSEGIAFDFIVVSGENSSLPHGVPTDRKIHKGDFITMDFGCKTEGYRSDMTRTVALGEVSDFQRSVYETVLKAQKAALKVIKAGVTGAEADKAARDVIAAAGYGEHFGHALGHGVGLEIHESPNLSPRNSAPLKVGNIVTVEPGIYLEGKFGVRIEDMVAVTDLGYDNFTKSNKELIIL